MFKSSATDMHIGWLNRGFGPMKSSLHLYSRLPAKRRIQPGTSI